MHAYKCVCVCGRTNLLPYTKGSVCACVCVKRHSSFVCVCVCVCVRVAYILDYAKRQYPGLCFVGMHEGYLWQATCTRVVSLI